VRLPPVISRSIGRRLALLLGLVVAAYGAISAWLSTRDLNRQLLDETRVGILRLVDTVKRSTRFDMMNSSREDVHRTIEEIGGQDGIEHVRIYNKEGVIVYSAAAEEIDRAVDRNAEACTQCHRAEQPLTHLEGPQRSRIFTGRGGNRVLAAIGVIQNEPGCSTVACHVHPESQKVLGVLDIGVSLADVDERVAAATTRGLLIGGASTVLVCLVVGAFVYRFVNRPVRRLLRGTQRVAGGDLDRLIPVDNGDEIGRLAESFNQMTRDLKQARSQLQGWARTLEEQVQEKTRDLEVAQAQVMRSEKLSSLGILAAGVAHELNSPLTGILTFAHLLLPTTAEGSQERADLELIVNETQRCATIIRQLLDFSHETEPETKRSSVNGVLRRALSLVERQALFHDIRVEQHLDGALPPLDLDSSQMEQVFLNLLMNAAEAMPDGGTLTLESRLDAATDTVQVVVRDTGVGIPPENLGRVFDPFFTSKEPGKGTGLGLAVTYGILQRHGGGVTVESEPGQGTTFTITLPVPRAAAVPS